MVNGLDRFREHSRYSGGWCSGCTGSLLSDEFVSVIMDTMNAADILSQEGLLLAQQQGSVARIWNLSSRNSERRYGEDLEVPPSVFQKEDHAQRGPSPQSSLRRQETSQHVRDDQARFGARQITTLYSSPAAL